MKKKYQKQKPPKDIVRGAFDKDGKKIYKHLPVE